MTRAFAQQLIEAGQPGSIVNISSVHAHSTMSGYAVYAGAKAGVEGLTRGVAVERALGRRDQWPLVGALDEHIAELERSEVHEDQDDPQQVDELVAGLLA
jgi:NADP-dependent 3-hydroxy acid dehydrogenase YdfG